MIDMTKARPRNFGAIVFVYFMTIIYAVTFFVMGVWIIRIVVYGGRLIGLIMTPVFFGFSIYIFYISNKFREKNFTFMEVIDEGIVITKEDNTEVVIPFSSMTLTGSDERNIRVKLQDDIDFGFGKGIIPTYTIPKEFQERIFKGLGKM